LGSVGVVLDCASGLRCFRLAVEQVRTCHHVLLLGPTLGRWSRELCHLCGNAAVFFGKGVQHAFRDRTFCFGGGLFGLGGFGKKDFRIVHAVKLPCLASYPKILIPNMWADIVSIAPRHAGTTQRSIAAPGALSRTNWLPLTDLEGRRWTKDHYEQMVSPVWEWGFPCGDFAFWARWPF